MTEQPKFYPADRLRERADKIEVIARKHVGDYRNTVLMEAWALRLAAEVVDASEQACRSAFVQMGFTKPVSDADMAETMALNLEAMREELIRKGRAQ